VGRRKGTAVHLWKLREKTYVRGYKLREAKGKIIRWWDGRPHQSFAAGGYVRRKATRLSEPDTDWLLINVG